MAKLPLTIGGYKNWETAGNGRRIPLAMLPRDLIAASSVLVCDHSKNDLATRVANLFEFACNAVHDASLEIVQPDTL